MRMPERWFGPVGAGLLACVILIIDLLIPTSGPVSILYGLVVMFAALGQERGAIKVWTGLSLGLTVIGFAAGPYDTTSIVWFVLSFITIAAIGILLVDREALRLAPVGLERRVRELRNFADSVPPLLWTTRADGYCDFLNQRFEDITGMGVTEALSDQSWTKPMHPDDVPDFLKTWEAARKRGEEYRTNFRLRHRDGSYRWMLSIGRPYRSATGEIERWYGGLSDVDAELRAQEKIKELNAALARKVEERTGELVQTQWRYRNLFDDKNIAVAECDFRGAKVLLDALKAEGVTDLRAYIAEHPAFLDACLATARTVDCNDTLLSMLGYTDRQELIAIPPADTVVDGANVIVGLFELIFYERSSASGPATLIGVGGRRVPVIFAANMSPDGRSYSTVFDITEREEAHALILAAQQELARANRVATLGALSVSIAHELNQPISSMAIDVDTCRRALELDALDRAALRRILERIERNTERLANIVERTRERISRQRRKPEPLQLLDIAEEVRVLLEHDFAARGAALRITCEPGIPPVSADKVELQQVFVNLLVNALDAMATTMEEKRSVDVWIARAETGWVQVSVGDTGPGISDENMTKLFQPFFTTKSGGIGMGLPICRATIEALGGELSARNRPEGGAVFEFALPAV